MSVDTVFIEGLIVKTLIGVHDWERRVLQPLVVSAWLSSDGAERAATDNLDDAIDYATVVEAIREFVAERTDGLLETLAEACVAMLNQRFPKARAIELRIDKPAAARNLGCGRVGVRIRREFR
ncbi:MAG: dihydroneopterin aldolase [Xanthomonadaceae bacterium]|nr:dihydroneopterin aldolase [Xanthomonadaceae bacterium]